MSEIAPQSTDPELSAYLSRMFDRIENGLENKDKLVVSKLLPPKPILGKQYYFEATIPGDPDITQEGLYVVKSTGWAFIA